MIENQTNHVKEQNRYVCKKANSTLGFLKRNTSACPKYIKEKCYKTLVKPILDYGCAVWDPHHKKQMEKIEKVQKNAARYVTNDYTFTSGKTKEHFEQLQWVPHQETRAKAKVTTLFKSLHNKIEIPTEQYKVRSPRMRTRQSGYHTFDIPTSNVDSHLYSFFPNTIRMWNTLPDRIKILDNTEYFKTELQSINIRT